MRGGGLETGDLGEQMSQCRRGSFRVGAVRMIGAEAPDPVARPGETERREARRAPLLTQPLGDVPRAHDCFGKVEIKAVDEEQRDLARLGGTDPVGEGLPQPLVGVIGQGDGGAVRCTGPFGSPRCRDRGEA